MKKKYIKKLCFDIDNTICSTNKNHYFSSKPNLKAIKKINKLYEKGFFIILFTSRFMGRNNENINLAKKKGFKFTTKQLKSWNLKYHKLIFGKPSFDLFIDDKSIYFKKTWYKDIDNYLIKKKDK